jgi:hypothetical protein
MWRTLRRSDTDADTTGSERLSPRHLRAKGVESENEDNGLSDARYSRNRVLAAPSSAERHTARQDELVGRSSVRTLSQASQVIRTMHRLAG